MLRLGAAVPSSSAVATFATTEPAAAATALAAAAQSTAAVAEPTAVANPPGTAVATTLAATLASVALATVDSAAKRPPAVAAATQPATARSHDAQCRRPHGWGRPHWHRRRRLAHVCAALSRQDGHCHCKLLAREREEVDGRHRAASSQGRARDSVWTTAEQ
jgi:hypothetical protein